MINTTKNPPPARTRPYPQASTDTTAQEHHATAATGPIRKATRRRRPSSEASNLARPRSQEQKVSALYAGRGPLGPISHRLWASAPYCTCTVFAAGILAARDPSAGIELPILAAAWSDQSHEHAARPHPGRNPGFLYPALSPCCWRSSSIPVLLVQGPERRCRRTRAISQQKQAEPAGARAEAKGRSRSGSRFSWHATSGGLK